MKLKFLGASGQVTGSSYLLTSHSNQSILVDFGLFQGSHEVESLNYVPFEVDIAHLSGVVLTHAHLDHCGRIPILSKNNYRGPIWMTPPTRDLTELSLYDTAKIQDEEEGKLPLYSKDDVTDSVALFRTTEYDSTFNLGDFEITLRDAGHILGSACIEIIDISSQKGANKIVFSGDLGNSPEDLIKPTEKINSSDFVVMESTYGDSVHPKEDASKIIETEIKSVEKTGGTLLIPAFSIERSQEMLHRIAHLKKEKRIESYTQIFFDSPLSEKATEVFEKYHEYYNSEFSSDFKDGNPFHFPGLNYVKDSKQSESIYELKGPKVILAGSGMMTGGRIVKHAANFLPIASTRLLFVGYQAEGTLGKKLLEGAKNLTINGKDVVVRSSVNEIQALSSHADQPKLLFWLNNIKGVSKLFLTHGEDKVRQIFSEKIKSSGEVKNIFIPSINEEVEL